MGALWDAFRQGINSQPLGMSVEGSTATAMKIRAQEEQLQKQYAEIAGLSAHANDVYHKQRPAYPRQEASFEIHPVGMISMRLHLTEGAKFPLPHIDAYICNGVAIVFVITKDFKPIIIEDDPALFPSDTLITQLRLLIG